MKNLFIVVCIILCFLSCKKKKAEPTLTGETPVVTTPEVPGKLLWDGDASKGTSIWKVASNIEGEGTITTVNDPTYGTVWKFTKPLGSHRTESHAANGFQAQEGDDIYIGWRCKVSMPPNINTNAVFQWKAYGSDMQQNFPIIISTTTGGDIHLMHYAPGQVGTELWKTPLKINAWNRFVLRLKISRDGTIGFIEFWYNDEKQTLKGGTQRYYGRTLDAEYCDPKWGVYGGDAQLITNYVGRPRIATTYDLVKPEKLNEPTPDPAPAPATVPVDPESITLFKTITASSELSGNKGSAAVDDDLDTYWQPAASDRTDLNIWLSADLGTAKDFNAMRIFWNRADVIAKYQLLYSDDGTTWQLAYEKTKSFSTIEKSTFPKVTARFVKLNIILTEDGSNLTTAEWRIFQE
ncbi:discoidin domain-containing protein [Mucilaginibacter boryungensis]|uniref:Discoidin domain-containing protein n=1 Tax=Mucilaginibacter boryungensis TaxID=768480 RepID=A0ABR9XIW0_9SPHI|nr:discoidin domain-containing protein [Mucilaginibacter boryungensis]MBE9666979.1 discoidin domain-containing protein [Mucilaginibacter boryungensis]